MVIEVGVRMICCVSDTISLSFGRIVLGVFVPCLVILRDVRIGIFQPILFGGHLCVLFSLLFGWIITFLLPRQVIKHLQQFSIE